MQSRRIFLWGATSALFAAAAPGMAAEDKSGAGLIARMQWRDKPDQWHTENGRVVVRPPLHTDYWHNSYTGEIRDRGAYFHLTTADQFTFTARVGGAYNGTYQQAGIMMRQDAENWVKCGTEYFDNIRHASVVVTHQASDWSVMPDLSQTEAVWWRAHRLRDRLDILVSANGRDFHLLRSAWFAPSAGMQAGLFCCAPFDQSFEATFDKLSLS